MSLPEISRRCLSCGAAVRAGSRFCHQCGKAVGAEARPGEAVEDALPPAPPTVERARPAEEVRETGGAPPTKEWAPPTKEFVAFEQSINVSGSQSATPELAQAAAAERETAGAAEPESNEEGAQSAEEAGRAGDLRGRVARVREGTRARVGRMREEAIVVLEETPDDSGLRFVLAAAALFALFLVLLFLSTTVLR